MGGVALASWLPWEWAVGAGVVGALIAAIWRAPFVLLSAALLLGIFRITSAPLIPPSGDLAERAGRTVSGTATVVSYPEPGSGRQRAVVEVETDGSAGHGGYHGKVLLYAPPHPVLEPGQVLRLKGRVQEPPVLDGFDYRRYLAKDGIHSVMYRPQLTVTGHRTQLTSLLYPARRAFLEHLGATFNEPAAGFLAAILIGDRTGIPDEIVDAFRRTGTIHVMALSGYNISILVAVLIAVIGRGRVVVWLVFLSIAAFVVFVGPSASVVRAALMGSFLLLSQVLGRPQAAVRGCVITAAAMLAFQPWALRYDLGFDLSFLATLGILLFEPAVSLRLAGLPAAVKGIVSPTVAASLPAMPLIALTFGTASLIAPFANLLVVPAIPWLMLGGFVATLASFAASGLAAVVALPVQVVTDGVLELVARLGQFSFASMNLGPWRLWFVGGTTVACLLAARLSRRPADA